MRQEMLLRTPDPLPLYHTFSHAIHCSASWNLTLDSLCGSTRRTRSGLSCYASIMFDASCIQNYAIRLDTSLVLLVYWLGEHVWFHQIFICTVKMYETSSNMSKKLQDDSKTATTPLPPAMHFPDISYFQNEQSIVTFQTLLVAGHTKLYNRRSLFQFKYHFGNA